MKVEWKDFAKRRRIAIDSFANRMTYEEYMRWCEIRSVIPLPRSKYVQKDVDKDIPRNDNIPMRKTRPPEPEWSKFAKLKKQEIINFCEACDVEYKPSDTKKVLVGKLKKFYST